MTTTSQALSYADRKMLEAYNFMTKPTRRGYGLTISAELGAAYQSAWAAHQASPFPDELADTRDAEADAYKAALTAYIAAAVAYQAAKAAYQASIA